jgi:precorrin-8X/cobalt-precorrin-8 methylmutase
VFDRCVVVDWSASSTPRRGRDSVWIATRDAVGLSLENPPTRRAAEELLVESLSDDGTTLLAVDFSLGFPLGTSDALGLDGGSWAAATTLLAELIVDRTDNTNNRFEVASALNERITGSAAPFWGCPPSRRTATLGSTKPLGPPSLPEWRSVERLLRERGHRPFSSWQLLGAGAVGSQSLLGIPMILRLAGRLGGRLQVWPFADGLRVPELEAHSVVVAEVWPSMHALAEAGPAVRDAQQVVAVADWLTSLDRRDEIGELFTPEVTDDVRPGVVDEEGWVLGVAG